jgi:hypothetical protein
MGRYGYWVVDGDGQVAEPESAQHLPAKYRDAAPRVITDNRGVKRVLIDGWFWTTPPGPGVGHPGGYIGGPRGRADRVRGPRALRELLPQPHDSRSRSSR